jgi:hypothetical protein
MGECGKGILTGMEVDGVGEGEEGRRVGCGWMCYWEDGEGVGEWGGNCGENFLRAEAEL